MVAAREAESVLSAGSAECRSADRLRVAAARVSGVLPCRRDGADGAAGAAGASGRVELCRSTCHGSASRTKSKSNVVQNEYLIWQSYDKHAKAYTVLQGDLGRRIAANLGIGPGRKGGDLSGPATADNVPPAKCAAYSFTSIRRHRLRGLSRRQPAKMARAACVRSHAATYRCWSPGLRPVPDRPADPAGQELCLSCHRRRRQAVHFAQDHGRRPSTPELRTADLYADSSRRTFVIDDKYRARKDSSEGRAGVGGGPGSWRWSGS